MLPFSRPSVRLNCVPYAASGKRGYIEPTRPCAANHIIVGELGDDEVLMIACDNGTVIGLWTDHLADIFGHREQFRCRMPPMKPFFVQDVGASACKSFEVLANGLFCHGMFF